MEKYGEILIILANIIWAFGGIFIRLSNPYTAPMMQVGIRLFIMTTIYLISFRIINKNFKFLEINRAHIIKLVFAGFFGIGFFATFFTYGILNTNYANAITLLSFSAIFVIVFSYVFLKEKISLKIIIATVVAFSGIIIMFKPSLGIDIGIIYSISAALLFAVYIIIMRGLKEINIGARLFYSTLVGTITVIILLIIFRIPTIITNFQTLIWYQIIASLIVVSGYTLFNLGINKIPANIAGILNITEPIFAVFIGYFIYSEILKNYEIIGSLMILCAIIMLNIKNGTKRIHTSKKSKS